MAKVIILLLIPLLIGLKCVATEKRDERLHVATTACDFNDRKRDETFAMIKSAILFSHSPLFFHIFADEDFTAILKPKLKVWQSSMQEKFTFAIYPITYPVKALHYKYRYEHCGTHRLFEPYALSKVYSGDLDKVLHVDKNVIFYTSIDSLWEYFDKFNDTQLAALSEETGFYDKRFTMHPFPGTMGVNVGVILMDLKKMKLANWTEVLIDYHKKYDNYQRIGAQDIINAYFGLHPEKLYTLGCSWNYRVTHCAFGSKCLEAEQEGVRVFYETKNHFKKSPAFDAIYRSMKKYEFGDDLQEKLLGPLRIEFEKLKYNNCGELADSFLKHLEELVKSGKKMRKLETAAPKKEPYIPEL